PVWINEFSAEREMIYVNSLSARFGSDNFYSVLAHEFCHMIQFNVRKRSIVWFDEGHAQLCERFVSVANGFDQQFLRQPDTRLSAAGPTAQDRVSAGNDLRATVHEYGARYVSLPQTPIHLKFTGPTTQRIIPTDAHSGHWTWWSDREDSMDTTLTRTVDLSNA